MSHWHILKSPLIDHSFYASANIIYVCMCSHVCVCMYTHTHIQVSSVRAIFWKIWLRDLLYWLLSHQSRHRWLGLKYAASTSSINWLQRTEYPVTNTFINIGTIKQCLCDKFTHQLGNLYITTLFLWMYIMSKENFYT